MNTNPDLGLTAKDNPQGTPIQEIMLNWTLYALDKKYGQNLKGQTLRSVNRLVNKMQRAVDERLERIELEESEKDIIRESFNDEVGFPVGAAKVVVAVQDEIASWNKK